MSEITKSIWWLTVASICNSLAIVAVAGVVIALVVTR